MSVPSPVFKLPPELHFSILDQLVPFPDSFFAFTSTCRYWRDAYTERKMRLLPGIVAAMIPLKGVFHTVRVYELVMRYIWDTSGSAGVGDGKYQGLGNNSTTVTTPRRYHRHNGVNANSNLTAEFLEDLLRSDDELYTPSQRQRLSLQSPDGEKELSKLRWEEVQGLGWDEEEIEAWGIKLGVERLERMIRVYSAFMGIAREIVPKVVWNERKITKESCSRVFEATVPTLQQSDIPKILEDDPEEVKEEKDRLIYWLINRMPPVKVVIPATTTTTSRTETRLRSTGFQLRARFLPMLMCSNLVKHGFPWHPESSKRDLLSAFLSKHGLDGVSFDEYGPQRPIRRVETIFVRRLAQSIESVEKRTDPEELWKDEVDMRRYARIGISGIQHSIMLRSKYEKIAEWMYYSGYDEEEMAEMLKGSERGDMLLRENVREAKKGRYGLFRTGY